MTDGYTILDHRGRRLAVVEGHAVEDATALARETYGDRAGWVVRNDGVTISHHPRVGRRHVAPWPPTEDAPPPEPLTVPARPYCPIWAALRHPSTAAEIAAVVPGVDRAVWARVPGAPRPEVGQPASETPLRGGLGYRPCQPHHPMTTPPASPTTSPECRPRPRRPWSSPAPV